MSMKISKEDIKHYLYALILKLSTDERREIISYLQGINLNSDITLPDMVDEIRKKRYSSRFYCPHCGSSKVKDKTQKASERVLLLRACSVKAV